MVYFGKQTAVSGRAGVIVSVILLAVVVPLVLSVWLTSRLRRSSTFSLLDHPNERSLHSIPVPRTGGIAICVSVALAFLGLALLIPFGIPHVWMASAALVVAGVSFLDDRFSLSVWPRIFIQGIAAIMLLLAGFGVDGLRLPGWQWQWPLGVGVLFSLMYVLWMTNLYNFMDGMDGFAAGMGLIGFGVFAGLAWLGGHLLFASLSIAVAAGAAGFLVFNFPPAKIFMGDTGSSTLGFLVGAFSLWADRDAIFPLWVAVLVFSPFIVDATVTLARRILRRDRLWLAHKTHYYQRLVQQGWGHKRTVVAEYILMAFCNTSAL